MNSQDTKRIGMSRYVKTGSRYVKIGGWLFQFKLIGGLYDVYAFHGGTRYHSIARYKSEAVKMIKEMYKRGY